MPRGKLEEDEGMHFDFERAYWVLGTINSYTKQRIEKALENYYEHEFKNRKLLWS
jgi:hypothetical protein